MCYIVPSTHVGALVKRRDDASWKVRRFDRSGLAKPTVRPDGSRLVECFVAKEGILEYQDERGESWSEFVPGEMLESSVDQLVGLPVTMEHPPEDVGPDNYERYAVGTVVSAEYDEEQRAIRCVLSVMRRDILTAIENGKREISPGYNATIDNKAGTSEYGPYDAMQTERGYNHVAVVDNARGGPSIRARVDSARNVIRADSPTGVSTMNPNLIALCAALGLGVEHSSEAEALRLVKRRVDAVIEAAEKTDEELETLKSDMEGVEKIDAEEHKRVVDENQKLRKMVDTMLAKKETDELKPMADAYEVEVDAEDRADSVYAKVATKITGKRVDAKDVDAEVRGFVKGHFAANPQGVPRQDGSGTDTSRSAWKSVQDSINAGRRNSPQPARRRRFRPGPSALSAKRADAAHRATMKAA